MKKLWMRLRERAGFTLVELVVVIAILGILAGVGTVAYSGYVEKANKAVDQQLVSEVKHALELGYYGGDLTGAGYVILSTNAAPNTGDDVGVNAALASAFGPAYTDLRLSYSGWGNDAAFDIVSILTSQGAEAANAVAESSYAGNVSQMLNDAQGCTNALAQFLADYTGGDMESSFTKLAGNSKGLEGILVRAGLAESTGGGNYSLVNPSSTTSTQLSNALILAIADEVSDPSVDIDEIADTWDSALFDNTWDGTGMSVLADLAARYAFYESTVAYFDDPTLSVAFENMNAAYNNAADKDGVLQAMNDMQASLHSFTLASYNKGEGSPEYQKLSDYTNQMAKDAKAFTSIMGAVDNVSDNFANTDTLSQNNMYLTDEVSSTVNSYVAAAKNYGNLPASISDGTVLVMFSDADMSVYTIPGV